MVIGGVWRAESDETEDLRYSPPKSRREQVATMGGKLIGRFWMRGLSQWLF